MEFWGKASEEGPLHHHIQTHFSNIIHRIGDSLKKIITINLSAGEIKKTTVTTKDHALSVGEIKRRMAGIPVYKLSNYSNDCVTIHSGHDADKGLLFHFICKPDALDFLEEINLHHELQKDCRIFDTPLSEVILVEGREPMVRLVPESSQIKNAIEEKEKEKEKDMTGSTDNIVFTGVPVFKSDQLRLEITKPGSTTGGEEFCPAYLRKEDLLEKINFWDISPATIEVAALEEIIHEMKDSSTNKSNNILFIGPGNTSWTWLSEHMHEP